WSCVFPMRKDLDLPAEAFLHLPQKQKFKPSILLERRIIEFAGAAVHRQNGSTTRLLLSDTSKVQTGDSFTNWKPFWHWDLRMASQRLQQHRPTPLDLEIELQEEVFFDRWESGE